MRFKEFSRKSIVKNPSKSMVKSRLESAVEQIRRCFQTLGTTSSRIRLGSSRTKAFRIKRITFEESMEEVARRPAEIVTTNGSSREA